MDFFEVSHAAGPQLTAPPFANDRGVEPDSDVEEPGIGLEPWDARGGTDAVEGVQHVVRVDDRRVELELVDDYLAARHVVTRRSAGVAPPRDPGGVVLGQRTDTQRFERHCAAKAPSVPTRSRA